ncbi:hypothetical protein [Streptomyces sp. NPDC000410]|uniref:hypothetical protein n=1 Tax=Streptomyces sp. NPDC000410 TaxID=3154254 RepID=UPI00332F11A9
MGVAMFDAIGLARKNARRCEELTRLQERLERIAGAENAAQERARRAVYDEALVPFRDAFARLKRVELAELLGLDPFETGDAVDVEPRRLSVDGVAALGTLAGGALVGAGAGVGTYLAVGAFATASTGTAVSSLSGAAATSATLAWLGGGSLAAGGGGVAAGTAVLTGIVAAPVLLSVGVLVEWQGRKSLREQREAAEELDGAEAELAVAKAGTIALCRSSKRVRHALRDLRGAIVERLPAFTELLDTCDDYARYSPDQRARVATLVGLATATVALMRCPVAEADAALADAAARLRAAAA